jgi:hypothetical protein
MDFDFEWDPAKAKSNMQKHEVTFEEAATVMRDPRAMNMYDPDHSESEDRWITLGISSSGRLLVVCHTFDEKPDASVTPLGVRHQKKSVTMKELKMRDEYDFSQAARGKLYRPDAKLNIPVYLDDEVQAFVQEIAEKRNTDYSSVVNQLLRGDMQLLKTMK